MLAKVLIVTFEPIPSPDGKAVRIDAVLRALQGRYDVDLLAPKIGDVAHIEIRSSARLLRVPLGAGHLHAQVERFARAVRRQLESEDYKIVHLCDPRVAGPACELQRARGFKLVFEPLGVPVLDLERSFPRVAANAELVGRLRAAEAMCLSSADVVIVGTSFASAHVSALEPTADVVVVPGGVDVSLYPRPALDKGAAALTADEADALDDVGRAPRGALGDARSISQSRPPPRIAYVGELAPWQGIGTLLRALHELRKSRADVRLTLTGPGRKEHLEGLASLARKLKIDSAIELGPPIAHGHVPARCGEADVCVVPGELDARARRFGPFAQKAVEAMASARPAVLSRLPAHEEVAPPGTSRFFAPGDAQALAAELLSTFDDPDGAAAMGRRAQEHVRASYSLPAFRDRLLACYALLLEDSRASAPRSHA